MSVADLDLTKIEKFHEEQTAHVHQPAIILYSPNTYHYTLLNVHNLESNLFLLHQLNGIITAEISEDVFGIVPVLNYHKNPDPVNQLADRILALQEKCGVKTLSIGTGADFYSVMQIAGGYFDCPDEKRKIQWQLFLNFIKIAEYMGIKNINGHRVVTIYPDRFKKIQLVKFGKSIGMENLHLGGLDPDIELGGAEAKSLELALNLLNASTTVSSTTELMYQEGMEPITIEQMRRFLTIMQANSIKPVVAHMDTGHIVAFGNGKKPEDYDLMAYTDIQFPRWAVHFNALYKNEHRMPTEENIEKDIEARNEKPDPVKSPYPRLYGDVYEWLRKTAASSRVMQVSPEPKPMDLQVLIKEVGECWKLLKNKFIDTHLPHPNYGGILIPKKMYDAFLQQFG